MSFVYVPSLISRHRLFGAPLTGLASSVGSSFPCGINGSPLRWFRSPLCTHVHKHPGHLPHLENFPPRLILRASPVTDSVFHCHRRNSHLDCGLPRNARSFRATAHPSRRSPRTFAWHPLSARTARDAGTDSIGLDTCLAIQQTIYNGTGDSKYRPSVLLERMVDAQWYGKKSGKGFYDYPSQ